MKFTLKGFAENLLFAANIFIFFLLFFGDKISIPYWLQPIGRMHPMLLHFPIVILMLAMVLEFFRFKEVYAKENLYQNFTSGLLLIGALFSAVTVVMGLFLSKEQAYSGEILQWHKWTGVSIVFVASGIYWCRNFSWYRAPLAKSGAVITTLCLIMAGHYGATLTHGNNFVLEPVMPPPAIVKVPVEKAKVFDDVIMPIFSQKCLGCHNLEKAKGGLILADANSVLKGGKTGELFVPGKPEVSLLLQRIHLPADEKKHMPPKNEAQLSDDEMAILALWVKNNAEMKKKVTDLSSNDSLRILATAYLAPSEIPEEKFDFSAADEKDIEKLSNNYRVIYPVAKNSPALSVNIYNKSIFKPEVLKELGKIKEQIISLNLSGMPLKDDDLKLVAEFENLRKLNINFTSVKGPGLNYLKDLKHLYAISLSGTDITYSFVNAFAASGSIKQLTLWNTKLSESDIQKVQKKNKKILVVGGFKDDGKTFVKLNQPRLNTDVSIFKKSFTLQIKHPINGVQIRYTTDGTEPDSIKSMLYKDGIEIKGNTMLKTRAYKPGWISSDVVAFSFYKSTYKPDSIVHLLPADEKYTSGGPTALIDGQLGNSDVNAGKWVGFIKNNMETLMLFKVPVAVQSVTLNVMKQVPAGVLQPQSIEVWGGADQQHLKLLGTVKSAPAKKDDPPVLVMMDVKFASQQVSCLKVVARNVKKLPAWHPGKGGPAWIFADEMFIN